jgi:uncharacterized membrane protein YkvA (DUF1232 family)
MGWRARLEEAARRLKRDALTVWILARDPRTPPAPKLVAAMVAAYAFSPVDLIPDFIPVLGLLDDLILVPLGLALALRLTPEAIVENARREAARRAERPVSMAGLAAMVAMWALAAFALWRLARRVVSF